MLRTTCVCVCLLCVFFSVLEAHRVKSWSSLHNHYVFHCCLEACRGNMLEHVKQEVGFSGICFVGGAPHEQDVGAFLFGIVDNHHQCFLFCFGAGPQGQNGDPFYTKITGSPFVCLWRLYGQNGYQCVATHMLSVSFFAFGCPRKQHVGAFWSNLYLSYSVCFPRPAEATCSSILCTKNVLPYLFRRGRRRGSMLERLIETVEHSLQTPIDVTLYAPPKCILVGDGIATSKCHSVT